MGLRFVMKLLAPYSTNYLVAFIDDAENCWFDYNNKRR